MEAASRPKKDRSGVAAGSSNPAAPHDPAPAANTPAPLPASAAVPGYVNDDGELQDLELLSISELPEAPPPATPKPEAIAPGASRDAPTNPPQGPASERLEAEPRSDHTKLRGALRLASRRDPVARTTSDPGTGSFARVPVERPPERPAPPTAPVVTVAPTMPAPAPAAPAAPSSTAPHRAPSPVTVPPVAGVAERAAPDAPPTPALAMDRDAIVRNQVIERYLSGRLPLKGAAELERFCREHPEYLDEIGLADRVNAGLRLLEASGKPEPWQEPARPAWQKPQVVVSLAVLGLVLASAVAVLASQNAARNRDLQRLRSQAAERPLDPATSTREIRLLPSRDGASNTPAVVIGGGPAQLIDLKIDESRSPYKVFRVTMDRLDQGRVAVFGNLLKDSNGHLRIALNSSAFGPGNYQLTIEGLTWRGDAEPDSWVTIGVQSGR